MKHRLIVIAALCVAALETLTVLDQSQILKAIAEERQRQDSQWGGRDHDEGHNGFTWFLLIVKHVGKLARVVRSPVAQDYRDIRDAAAILGRQVEDLI